MSLEPGRAMWWGVNPAKPIIVAEDPCPWSSDFVLTLSGSLAFREFLYPMAPFWADALVGQPKDNAGG